MQPFWEQFIPQNMCISKSHLAFCLCVQWGQGASVPILCKQTHHLPPQLSQEAVGWMQGRCHIGDFGSCSVCLVLYPFSFLYCFSPALVTMCHCVKSRTRCWKELPKGKIILRKTFLPSLFNWLKALTTELPFVTPVAIFYIDDREILLYKWRMTGWTPPSPFHPGAGKKSPTDALTTLSCDTGMIHQQHYHMWAWHVHTPLHMYATPETF